MSEYDITDKCEGMLNVDDQTTAQQQMFARELDKFIAKSSTLPSSPLVFSKLISNILENFEDKPGDSGFGRCHSKNHASTGGGTGFGKSYSKRC